MKYYRAFLSALVFSLVCSSAYAESEIVEDGVVEQALPLEDSVDNNPEEPTENTNIVDAITDKPTEKNSEKNSEKTRASITTKNTAEPENAEAEAAENISVDIILNTTDKINGNSKKLHIISGSSARFGELEIKAKRCFKRDFSNSTKPEYAALLEISDSKNNNETLFSGWMFSKSSSLSTLEHQFYDVEIVSCQPKITDDSKSAVAKQKPPAPPTN